MKKVSRIVGLCSRPLQRRYLAATPEERRTLDEVVRSESDWIISKLRRKGYELEGTVCGVYGVFTRGQARGTLRLLDAAAVSR
jgi:hypothetical protein